MSGAYDLVKADGGKTAITLYLNEGCWERPQNEMFAWAAANIPQYIKDGVDYVFVSYYEDDCNGRQPNWQAVFERLGAMFPNSLLGVGECGTTKRARKEEYLRRYYTMRINHPRYVGGHFWWYFNQDMVPSTTKPLWHTLDELMRAP